MEAIVASVAMIVVVAAAIVNAVLYFMIVREKRILKNIEGSIDARIELGRAVEHGLQENVEALKKQSEFFQEQIEHYRTAVAHYESVRRQAEGERVN